MISSTEIVFLGLLVYLGGVDCWKQIDYDRDGDLSLKDLMQKYGSVGLKTYELTLPDGYIISVYRIDRIGADEMKPILLLHGLSACGDTFFLDKKKALPFYLSKMGYDIWLINNRGTLNSRRHKSLNSTRDKEYWQFSWQEIGMIDMPATIDLILSHNKHDKVALIGHSEGSFEIFVGLSELPEYNKKVAISFHFGGAAYHSGCKPEMMQVGCTMRNFIQEFLDEMGITQIMPTNELRNTIISLCRIDILSESCHQFFFDILVVSDDLFDDFKDISFLFSKWLCGGGVREILHFLQTGKTGRFAKFDHGPKKNLEIYNSTTPPRFHLERITSPTAIFCGLRDIFCREEDIERAKAEIPNIVLTKIIEPLGHVDFLLDKQLKRFIYDDMFRLLKKYL